MAWLDKKAILNALTEADIIKICLDLGSESYHKSKDALVFQTIDHNVTDGSYKLYYYHKAKGNYPAKIFHVYTTGESFGVIELVIRAKSIRGETYSWIQALEYIATVTGHLITSNNNTQKTESKVISDFSFINLYKQANVEKEELKLYNEHLLELFCYLPHTEFLKDHISKETMETFEIGYYGLTNQITIPHRDIDNRLIGIRARNLEQTLLDAGMKYVPMQIENQWLKHPLGRNLYGINVNREAISKAKRVILFEAEKSVMQCHTYWGENDISVAVCGSNLSDEQIELIRKLGVSEIVFALDKEFKTNNSAKEASYRNKLYKKVRPYITQFEWSFIWDKWDKLGEKDSPTDKGKEVFEFLFHNRVPITATDIKMGLEEG